MRSPPRRSAKFLGGTGKPLCWKERLRVGAAVRGAEGAQGVPLVAINPCREAHGDGAQLCSVCWRQTAAHWSTGVLLR